MSLPRHLVGFGDELRREGVAIGTSELNDAFAALGEVDWTRQGPFRETMSVIVKHRTDLDTVAERIGVKLAGFPATARQQ